MTATSCRKSGIQRPKRLMVSVPVAVRSFSTVSTADSALGDGPTEIPGIVVRYP
jgi:hypothetical protein